MQNSMKIFFYAISVIFFNKKKKGEEEKRLYIASIASWWNFLTIKYMIETQENSFKQNNNNY